MEDEDLQNYGVGTGMPDTAAQPTPMPSIGDTNAGLSRNTGTGSNYQPVHGGDTTDRPQQQAVNNRPRPIMQQAAPAAVSTINPGPDDWLNRDIMAGSANGAKL